MDYKQRVSFNTNDVRIINALRDFGIEYKTQGDCGIGAVELLESDPRWAALKAFLGESNYPYSTTAVYSKDEIKSAEWFSIRSKWRWEYPQPDSGNFGYMKNITYAGVCPECGANAVQVGKFRVKRSPKWNLRAFLMLNWVHDVLFVSESAKNILETAGLKGFHFQPVLNTRGSAEIGDIYQLCVETELPTGRILNDETTKQKSECSVCGTVKYVSSGRGSFYKRETFDGMSADIAVSKEIFGFGHMAIREIVISRQFYETVITNKLDRQLEIAPICLVAF